MTDDIVARLRVLNHHAKKLAENESLNDLHRDAFTRCEDLTWKAADEIERLRRELGQVSDADSWVSEADAAHLDSLLKWCEFNDMESHRALQRLVNDRARLRGEVTRLRKERNQARAEVVDRALGIKDDVIWVINYPTRKRCENYARSRGWHDLWDEVNEQERLIREGRTTNEH